jgi:nitroreductase
MTVQEAIATRRSVRQYSDKPLEQDSLNIILEAARLSPSSANSQNWRFIVVTDKALITRLMDAAYGQPFVGEAPCAIVACGTDCRIMDCGQPTDTVDLSIAMTDILLQAHELGLGTCWLGHFSAEKVKDILGIPDGVSVVAFTPLGYPAGITEARPRKTIGEIVSYNKS